jgi:phage FluMu gp28-like protein
MPTGCNPYINKSEIDEAKRNLPERTFQQEYLAQFLDDAGGVFRNISACTYNIKNNDWWREEQKNPDGRAYVIGVDLARVEDFTVLTVVDARERRVVAIDRFNQVEYVMQLDRLITMAQRFKGAPILIESNNTGLPFIEQAKRKGLPVRAFQTTNASKAEIIEKLAMAFEQSMISIPDYAPLINELMCFDQERLPSGAIRYGAPQGQHDDCVMSLAICWHGATGIAQSAPITSTARIY